MGFGRRRPDDAPRVVGFAFPAAPGSPPPALGPPAEFRPPAYPAPAYPAPPADGGYGVAVAAPPVALPSGVPGIPPGQPTGWTGSASPRSRRPLIVTAGTLLLLASFGYRFVVPLVLEYRTSVQAPATLAQLAPVTVPAMANVRAEIEQGLKDSGVRRPVVQFYGSPSAPALMLAVGADRSRDSLTTKYERERRQAQTSNLPLPPGQLVDQPGGPVMCGMFGQHVGIMCFWKSKRTYGMVYVLGPYATIETTAPIADEARRAVGG